MNIPEQIHAKLAALQPIELALRDDSAKHAGHAGAASGGGHYQLYIVSECFAGLTLVARHRLVYETLGELMRRDIHALAIDARTPGEAQR
ncbi:BolA family protein [Chitinimonas taiwanensis]|uniref:Transcriptional regulator, BolA protein family n=1 Tax=Chitinimonas taiwanensis DSM 18899 TaxID=1121279 RepID=A0A1K2HLJ9_9NEIS|nr:BolA family protein [Chitinimonas taiwanensis]SFZ77684.1 transcriptional regulator, BolA protein family [Chitinimonas taiwanensis DSM 18899]